MTPISHYVMFTGLGFVFAGVAGMGVIAANSETPIYRSADVLNVKAPIVITPNDHGEGASCLFRLAHEKGGLGYPKPPQISAQLDQKSDTWLVLMKNDRSYPIYKNDFETKVSVADSRVVRCVNNKREHSSWRIIVAAAAVFGAALTALGGAAAKAAKDNPRSRPRYPNWS